MNPNSDIGWNCEQALIEILSTNSELAALAPTHEDVDTDIDKTRIIVKADRVLPEAPNPRNPQLNVRRIQMRVMIRVGMGQMTADALYANFGTLCQIMENMDGATYGQLPSMKAFSYLQPTLALENEREKEDNRRKMVKTLDFLAILKNSPILP